MHTSGWRIYGATAILGVLTLAACGGGSSKALPAAATATAAPLSSVTVALTVPNRIAVAGKNRSVQFISPSSQSVQFTVAPGGVQTTVNLTGPVCVPNALNTSKLCTFSVSAPVGNDTFQMLAYDNSNATGTVLSAASNFSATIAEGKADTLLPVIMGGVPASVVIAFADGTTTQTISGAGSKQVVVTVYDHDNNIIVAPGAFVNAAGALTPITLTSSSAGAGIGYKVTPASTGVQGSFTGNVSLAEPDDQLVYAYSGNGFVPENDTLTQSVVNHGNGLSFTQFGMNWLIAPPFTPTHLLALSSAMQTTLGRQGIFIADSIDNIGFVGSASGQCVAQRSDAGGPITAIGGITADGNSDVNLYFSAFDPGIIGGLGLVFNQLPMANVLNGSCSYTNQAVPNVNMTPYGVAAANGSFYAVAYGGSDYIYSMTVPNNPSPVGGIINGGADFGTASVSVIPSGVFGVVQFAAKKRIDEIALGGNAPSVSANLATLSDPYPYGTTVDANGAIYANNTTQTTYGTAGGVDVYAPFLGGVTGRAQLNAPVVHSGPAGAIQNMSVNAGTNRLVVACTDGIEVFSLPLPSTPTAPIATLTPSAPAVSVVWSEDGPAGRPWAILSDGHVEALVAP